MGTHNTCLYKEVDKNYTVCNLKTTELFDCALIGACAIIRSNMINKVTQERPQSQSRLKKKVRILYCNSTLSVNWLLQRCFCLIKLVLYNVLFRSIEHFVISA